MSTEIGRRSVSAPKIARKTEPAASSEPGQDLDLGRLKSLMGYALRRAQLVVFENFAKDFSALGLRPALALKAHVAHVKRVHAGERISYGLRHTFTADTTVATLPLGYADGVPRRLHQVGGAVLVGGRRRPIVGVVTMDQLMVDCGDDAVAVGDEAVLLGEQGEERITAADWAEALDTIAYEVVCGISARVERRRV
jgi:alanine racemase